MAPFADDVSAVVNKKLMYFFLHLKRHTMEGLLFWEEIRGKRREAAFQAGLSSGIDKSEMSGCFNFLR